MSEATQRISPFRPYKRAVAVVVGFAVFFALWPIVRDRILGTPEFMPHRTCYLNNSSLIWTHAVSDFLIGLAYISISLTLAYLVQVARVPFHLAFIAFGVFIGACGATHFMEVWTVWEPRYWLAAGVKIVTAAASVATAIWLYPLLPKAIELARSAELAAERKERLEKAHAELQQLYSRVRELDELKTHFFSNISHELRTPLSLILAPARKMSSLPELNDAVRRDAELIERNARILLRHVNDLLDLSKLDAREMRLNYSNVDLAQLLRLASSNFLSLAKDRGIELTVEAPPSMAAQVDPEKIERIVLNLISNSLKFVPGGGKVFCRLAQTDGAAMLTVEDNGPGVPESMRQVVFDRFRQVDSSNTRKIGGTGLGLSIVKEFAELHRGSVSVDERPGGGARFIVKLPLKAPTGTEIFPEPQTNGIAKSEQTELAMAEHQAAGNGATQPQPQSDGASDMPLVLVVEDNKDLNRYIVETLGRQYRVIRANNGEEGLRLAAAHRPDLVITDVMMPGISGEELLEKIRAHPEISETPVLVLTAKADDESRIRLLQQGAQDFVTKPILMEELQLRVRNHLSMWRARNIMRQELASRSGNLEALASALASRKREVEAAREEAENANRAKDEFLATLSHELRTPLTSVLGWVRLLQSGRLQEPDRKRAADTIERNARAQTQLIDDLLDMSRIVTGKLRLDIKRISATPVVTAALDSARPAAEAKQIQLNFKLTQMNCTVLADATRLQQIVWNLLSNAVKFTPVGGRVDVALELNAGMLELRVTDTGPGIRPEFLPHLFERFRQADSSSTRQYGGLGIGLALVRHLTELHGGSVRAESAGEGKGSTFILSLPCVLQPELSIQRAERPASQTLPPLSHFRVLVVDDDADTRELLIAILSECGAEAQAAPSVNAAMKAIAARPPEVVITDIGMPEEDGYALLRKIQARSGPAIPVMALTAYARPEDQEKMRAAGFRRYLRKPIDPAELADSLKEIVQSSH